MAGMSRRARRLALTAHIVSSVGWLGSVVAFLGLATVAATTQDQRTLQAVYVVAEPIVWFVVVPFASASLLTGLVSALGSAWGLFRHYWVIFKLLLNLLATTLLLLYTPTVGYLADVAAGQTGDFAALRSPTFLLHAGGALLVLLVATVLAVYKPRGMTAYGRRRSAPAAARSRR